MAWNKLKSMFVVTDEAAPAAMPDAAVSTDPDDVLRQLEKYQIPAEEKGALPPDTSPAALSGTIDFQALYDQAGIPNTDEVEALERFLKGLDTSLPEASKVAAAKAFLGAIGKGPSDVVQDAGRKIAVVRAVGDAKRADTDNAVGQRRAQIDELQRQIDEQKQAIEQLQKELESVRSQCAIEESRLTGARMFFGHVPELVARAGK